MSHRDYVQNIITRASYQSGCHACICAQDLVVYMSYMFVFRVAHMLHGSRVMGKESRDSSVGHSLGMMRRIFCIPHA